MPREPFLSDDDRRDIRRGTVFGMGYVTVIVIFLLALLIGGVSIVTWGFGVGTSNIKGKLSAVNSSLTNPTQTWEKDCGADCGYGNAVESIGDDGTFGTNEGGDRGVFFLTTNGAMVVTVLDWMYVDKPISIGNIPQLYG